MVNAADGSDTIITTASVRGVLRELLGQTAGRGRSQNWFASSRAGALMDDD